jgi:hypothetical protein
MTEEAVNPLDVRNAGKPWDEREAIRLSNLAAGNQPMRLIVRELGRPESEIRAQGEELGISFETGNYNRLRLHEEQFGSTAGGSQ